MTTKTQLKHLLKEKGLKATSQRMQIAREIAGRFEHISSEDIFDRVRKRFPSISRATIYNTLHSLAEHGVVKKLELRYGKVMYDTNSTAHHHLVCEDTGEIIDIPNEWIGRVSLNKIKSKFDIRDFSITFRGYHKSKGAKT